MAKQSAGFIDLHAEKLVLGLCVLLLAGAGVYSFGGMRFKIDGRGPAELCEEAGREADRAAAAVRRAEPAKPKDAAQAEKDDPIVRLREWFSPDGSGLVKIAGIEPEPWRTQRFPPIRPEITGVPAEDRHNLARIVAPSPPLVTTGRTTFDMPEPLDFSDFLVGGERGDDSKTVTRNYVSVAAQVDLVRQERNFYLENYPERSSLSIVKVDLQRMDEDEPWRGWQQVDTYLPFKPLKLPSLLDSKGQFKLGEVTEFNRLIDRGKEYIVRTRLPSRRATPPPVPYLFDPPKINQAASEGGRLAKRWTDLAKKAIAGKKPFAEKDYDAACMLARAAMAVVGAGEREVQAATKVLDEAIKRLRGRKREAYSETPRAPERLMPLVAHDLSAIPGHTYVYRIRYEVLNIYAGNPGELKNPADAEVLTVSSDWSLPTRPVEIERDVLFFLTKADPRKQEATVKVFKKTRAGWKDQEYRVGVGEKIGAKEKRGRNKGVDFTTGAVCVDIDFSRIDPSPGGKRTAALVYVEPDEGRLMERFLSRDRKNKLMRKLSESQTAQR
jgi:hypothetical protein